MYEVELELAKAHLSALKRAFDAFKNGHNDIYEVHRLSCAENIHRIITSIECDMDYVDICMCKLDFDKYKLAYYQSYAHELLKMRDQFKSVYSKINKIDRESTRYKTDNYGYIDNSESDAEMSA